MNEKEARRSIHTALIHAADAHSPSSGKRRVKYALMAIGEPARTYTMGASDVTQMLANGAYWQ